MHTYHTRLDTNSILIYTALAVPQGRQKGRPKSTLTTTEPDDHQQTERRPRAPSRAKLPTNLRAPADSKDRGTIGALSEVCVTQERHGWLSAAATQGDGQVAPVLT